MIKFASVAAFCTIVLVEEIKPIIWGFPAFSQVNSEGAIERVRLAASLLDLESNNYKGHPLQEIYTDAVQAYERAKVPWVSSTVFSELATWGAQLEIVQDWRGFEELVERIKKDKRNWEAYLHEAATASKFKMMGCHGEFFVSNNETIPDLKIAYKGSESVVECRRSRYTSEAGERSRRVWYPAVFEIREYLERHTPSAVFAIKVLRDAQQGDKELFIQGAKSFIDSWREEKEKGSFQQSEVQHRNFQASDGSFEGGAIICNDGDVIFDAIADGPLIGLELPNLMSPVSIGFQGMTGQLPKMDKFWYCKIDTDRHWGKVEKLVLERLDKKAKQLNRFRRSGVPNSELPGIVWIDHPSLSRGGNDELTHLARRIQGKLTKNVEGHFNAVAGVILSHSWLSMSKNGLIKMLNRIAFASNPNDQHDLSNHFPYISWHWWREVLGNRESDITWMGEKVVQTGIDDGN